MRKLFLLAFAALAMSCQVEDDLITIEEENPTRSFTTSWVSGKTSKGATLPSLSRITYTGLGHYNQTIDMEFTDLEFYNSTANGSEVVFSASDPYYGTFWITIKMNETGVPYGYVLNNTNGSNDYLSSNYLQQVSVGNGFVSLTGSAKKGISGTQYKTKTMTLTLYQGGASSGKSSDRVPEFTCEFPPLAESAPGLIAAAKRAGLGQDSLKSESWFFNQGVRTYDPATGTKCSRKITVELTVEEEIVYGESLCGENPINCEYTNDVQYKVWYRSLRLINGNFGVDLVMEDYGLSSMIIVQNETIY